MAIDDLKKWAKNQGIVLTSQGEIANEATSNITQRYNYSIDRIKSNFDTLLDETEQEAYKVYLQHEAEYGMKVFQMFIRYLITEGELRDVDQIGTALGGKFKLMDKFFLSISQSRRTRAGQTFEAIQNALFRRLSYPFTYQPVINGKPDFVMPSIEHYHRNPMDCIIFTTKRTLRERWRQIVTEGTRGLGFFLATIDTKISQNQLDEMLAHRIYLVCPERIRITNYPNADNVLSFAQFFRDHVDPAMERWKRNGVIPND